ncbi:OLC1v1013596C1 [Oldenlandia corymbosa var. corymbosa]|uniref:OLC1v1013596C1 n=1 Tax=Oldenlandia corymbosa var. corymbosa TaxID=529605 RepID=A0AAV1E290_OLDCO|nr:OLC1v1013596C1 [Oldenlandia corymbosa var. corymbosa]
MAPTVPIEYTGQRELTVCSKKGLGSMMGKSRKVSKGYSSGFVPDYRHAVETIAESEGFGSSGRVDVEMTASENSYAPKRKAISSNGQDGYDRFGVPIQVFSLSKMSRSDRRDLERKFKNDLEQVRSWQRRITSISSKPITPSPASDIHSNGLKGTPMQNPQRPVKLVADLPSKNKPSTKNRPRPKGPVKPNLPSNANNIMLMKQCETLLKRLMEQEYGWVFNTPVDPEQLKIPDYFNVIKHPMDLGTVKTKLLSGAYSDISEFAADVRLTFTNAMTYNPPGNDVHVMAKEMSKYFEVRWKPIEKKITSNVGELLPPKPNVKAETENAAHMPPSKKVKTSPVENLVKPEIKVKQIMSASEKHKLSADLEPLLPDLPDNIVDFLRQSSANASKASGDEFDKDAEDEIEIDMEALSDDTLFTLRKLIDDYLLDKQKNQSKDSPPVELHDVPGLSTSVIKPEKGNDLADEEVDIGGNDPPMPIFPPVEIDKDSTRRNSKHDSSSSSSSASGSSSSDSDTGSSSSGGSDMAKHAAPRDTPKPRISDPAVNLDQRTTEPDAGDTPNDVVRQNNESVKSPVEPDLKQEAESAPIERTVSPEKLYRAAILRSRFADTIIKAKEKTLEKGDKLASEERERIRKQERARLQAEAKAAKEAVRKAEEAAAAEARRKRELEREAARQALQNKDDDEEEEQEPEADDVPGISNDPEDGEIDGLYIKKDDDEEEEPEAHGVPGTSNDPEDGEIDGLYTKKDIVEEKEPEAPSVTGTSNDPEDGEIDGLYTRQDNDQEEPTETLGAKESNDPEEGEID